MRKQLTTTVIFCIVLNLLFYICNAQDTWVSYSKAISVKGYEGHNFRLTAMVKSDLDDDSASAHLWARVDKEKGDGFFDNMDDRPIRTSDWKLYTVQGKIDTGANRLVFGLYCMFNGRFYFDNMNLEIESGKNKWEKVYAANFDDGAIDSLQEGIQTAQYGLNAKYSTQIVNADNGANKVLLV
ncbi:MAG TPA: hypothetical protein VGI82_10860, partial [Chitinophagaceae bacterium]